MCNSMLMALAVVLAAFVVAAGCTNSPDESSQSPTQSNASQSEGSEPQAETEQSQPVLSPEERKAAMFAICVGTKEALDYPGGKDPLEIAKDRTAVQLHDNCPRCGYLVAHMLYLYKFGGMPGRGPTEQGWSEADCATNGGDMDVPVKDLPAGSISQAFAQDMP